MATASSINALVQRRGESSLAKQKQFEFASTEDAVHDLKTGRMIVVIDDEDRENEGDLTMAAEMITPEAINSRATMRHRHVRRLAAVLQALAGQTPLQ